jgi:hypothetical protein
MANKNETLQAIYVELDVLLDTRLGTLARIGQDVAARILGTGSYHTRQSDDFEGVSKDQFQELYSARDTLTLAHSTVTGAILWLKRLAGVLADQAIERPYHDGIQIVVNTYPYQLTSEEQGQMVEAIAAWIRTTVTTKVELVSIATKDLTPLHCKSSYAMMMIYDYQLWMETHSDAFKQHRLPEVTLFGPMIYAHKVPTAEELEKAVKEAAHPFMATEMLASPLIDLKLIDVKFFSILQK